MYKLRDFVGFLFKKLWGFLTVPLEKIHHAEDEQRAKVVTAFFLFSTLSIAINQILGGTTPRLTLWILLGGYFLARTHWYKIATIILIVALTLPSYYVVVKLPDPEPYQVFAALVWVILPLLLVSLIFSVRTAILIYTANIAVVLALPFLYSDLSFRTIGEALGFFILTSLVILIVMIEQIRLEDIRQAELRRSQERFYKIFHTSPDAISISELENGRIIDINNSFSSMLGYAPDECIGRTSIELNMYVNHADRFEMVSLLKEHSEINGYEIRLRHKNGTQFIASASVSPIELDGKACLIWMARNVTIQKQNEAQREKLLKELEQTIQEKTQAEKALQQSAKRYRDLLENIPAITYIIGVGYEPINRANYVSPQIEKVTGHASAEFLDDPLLWTKLIHADDRARVMAESDRADQTGEPFVSDYRILTDENKIFWFHDESVLVKDEHGQPLYRLGVWSDITERKLSELARQHSENLYRQAIAAAGTVPYVLDHSSHTLSFIGDGILAMTGYSASEMMSSGAWNTAVQEGFPRGKLAHLTYEEANHITDEDNSIVWECDFRIRTRDGKTRWIADTSVKSYDQNSNHIVSIGIKQDITERKQAETERESFIKELEMRNAEMERFLYIASHDLKSPVVTIKGFLGLLKKDIEENRGDRVQKDFERISEATEKMGTLLSDLLELSRIGRIANPLEEIDLNKLTQEVLEILDDRVSSSNVTIHVSPELPIVYGDRVRLREVFENIIDNAAKYMGGQKSPLIEIGKRDTGNEIAIFVKDNGMGVDPKYHTKIFGLFEKLNAASEGTGIGLALIKRIIEVHGGKIWVESDGLGKGSTFCFTIPDNRKTSTITST